MPRGCCGGLAWHTGDLRSARLLARRNLAAFPADVDAVVTNAAGCGSALHEYPLMLRGTPEEDRARAFAGRVCDAGAYLARLGLREPLRGFGGPRRIAYHDACHLANAQGVRAEPRSLLAAIPGVELCEVADAHLCCGSAGTYNLDQPGIADALGAKKARAVAATGAHFVATGTSAVSPNCASSWRNSVRRSRSGTPFRSCATPTRRSGIDRASRPGRGRRQRTSIAASRPGWADSPTKPG